MSSPTQMWEPGFRIGRYEVLRKLGEGGMGAVFEARHTVTGKRVALKSMAPELSADADATARFVREAQAACRIDHPNVVQVHDVDSIDGTMFLVMDLLKGESLGERMERLGPMSSQSILDLILPALDGLAAVHEAGIVHRDIKPDNIFLCERPKGASLCPKLLDFGISKLSSGPDGNSGLRLTQTGTMMGTPFYMAPEQVTDAAGVDCRADIYSFACVMYEALSGSVPIQASSYQAVILAIVTTPPTPLHEIRPDLPPEVVAVVMRALAKRPEDRYPDVDTFAAALRTAVETWARLAAASPDGVPSAVEAGLDPDAGDSPPDLPALPVRKSLRVGIALCLAVALLGVGFWAVLRSSNEPSDGRDPSASSPPSVLSHVVAPVAQAAGASTARASQQPVSMATPEVDQASARVTEAASPMAAPMRATTAHRWAAHTRPTSMTPRAHRHLPVNAQPVRPAVRATPPATIIPAMAGVEPRSESVMNRRPASASASVMHRTTFESSPDDF